MRKILSLFIIGLLIHSCEKDDPIGIPGKFELQFLTIHETTDHNSPMVASFQGSYSQDDNEIHLDTIKSSTSFYFMIKYVGSSDITGLTMTTDNDNFLVSPSSIPLIPGTSSDGLLNQVYSIDVLHGTRINGIGSAEFLDKGDNICNLRVKGEISKGRSNTTVAMNINITVYAEIMSISLIQGKFEYDLNTRDVLLSGFGTYDIDAMKMFYYFTINPPVTIQNTGNVNINMTLMSFDTGNPITHTAMIQPNDSLNLLLPLGGSDGREGGMIRLDSEGTVFDINKLCLGRDGAAYFALKYPSDFWFSNHTPPNRIYW
jgi:hypothetical protein